ncbi:MAG TPA: hypothetical protein VGE74_32640 [Gemmata sp.]
MQLRHLNVSGNKIGDEGARVLASAPWRLSHLRAISIGLTSDGARELARSPALAGLISLDLSHNTELGPTGAAALFENPVWRDLRGLSLGSKRTDAKVLDAVATTRGLNGLHSLHLGFCPFGDAGLSALAKWPGLASVRLLDLSYCGIGRAGAEALLASPLRPGANLQLYGNFKIPQSTIERLRKKHGDAVWWSPCNADS